MRRWKRRNIVILFLLCVLLFFLFVITQEMGELSGVPHHKRQPRIFEAEGPKEKHSQRTKAVFLPGVLGNFEPPEVHPDGPGEDGNPVLLEEGEEDKEKSLDFGYSVSASDKMAMNRTVKDTRMSECKFWHYPEDLPKASVILVFFHEGWSPFVRTIHSVINTSPAHLLHEVILVDDQTDVEELKSPLEEYIKRFHGLVKLVRSDRHLGLISARTAGAKAASGDVIVFLDSHCECNRNWLPPLLTRIKNNRRTVAVPMVDVIDHHTMQYRLTYISSDSLIAGIFEWGFYYKEMDISDRAKAGREHKSEPYPSPTHAGGLLAMDRNFFLELGGYDPGLLIWGGENYELSFKAWMCGGRLEWVPCSRVGHIYRGPKKGSTSPSLPEMKGSNRLLAGDRNYVRVVEVWMEEEFKEYFYTRMPYLRGAPHGDISQQLQLKQDLQCQNFRWFMDNVAYDLYSRFPPLPPNVAWGKVMSTDGNRNVCLQSRGLRSELSVSSYCRDAINLAFRLNTHGQLGNDERCIDSTLHVVVCPTQPGGPWRYDQSLMQISLSKEGTCLSHDGKHVMLEPCDTVKAQQKWRFEEYYPWKY